MDKALWDAGKSHNRRRDQMESQCAVVLLRLGRRSGIYETVGMLNVGAMLSYCWTLTP